LIRFVISERVVSTELDFYICIAISGSMPLSMNYWY